MAVISIAAEMGWKIHQMDVKTTFLNGLIQEEVYIEKPLGFEVHGRESHVCRMKKALYGLKQAPRAWYSRIDDYFHHLGFEKSEADPNLYFIVVGEDCLILLIYVDDLFITGDERLITSCKEREPCFRVLDERYWTDALFLGVGGLAGAWTHLSRTREVCF
jgi:hypothetical protein